PSRVTIKESDVKISGSEVVTASTAMGTVGLSICYDLRFPELYRQLAFAGARILTIPSAFTFPTGEAHWEILIRARAVENQCYVIAPAQFGLNVHGFSDYGNSMIADPWGRVVARAPDQEGVIVAPIDMEYLERVRRELPALAHAQLRPNQA
ncbi:MAG: nitrilase-related carbon-nitrogen hydrolase, partial [Candidatus Binataceae bacterium]